MRRDAIPASALHEREKPWTLVKEHIGLDLPPVIQS